MRGELQAVFLTQGSEDVIKIGDQVDEAQRTYVRYVCRENLPE